MLYFSVVTKIQKERRKISVETIYYLSYNSWTWLVVWSVGGWVTQIPVGTQRQRLLPSCGCHFNPCHPWKERRRAVSEIFMDQIWKCLYHFHWFSIGQNRWYEILFNCKGAGKDIFWGAQDKNKMVWWTHHNICVPLRNQENTQLKTNTFQWCLLNFNVNVLYSILPNSK